MSKYSERIKEQARAAAARLRKYGWCKGEYFKGKKCCALGAIRKACKADQDDTDLARAFASAIGVGQFDVHKWNDKPERTKEEVIEAFDRIANS